MTSGSNSQSVGVGTLFSLLWFLLRERDEERTARVHRNTDLPLVLL